MKKIRVISELYRGESDVVDDFRNEVKIARLMGRARIGPVVYHAPICRDDKAQWATIVMDRYDMSLQKYADTRPFQFLRSSFKLESLAFKLLEKMHELGVVHRDIHAGNILLKLNKRAIPTRIVFADWGRAVFSQNEKATIKDEDDLADTFETARDDAEDAVLKLAHAARTGQADWNH